MINAIEALLKPEKLVFGEPRAARQQVMDWTRGIGEPAYAILQAFEKIEFVPWTGAELPEFEKPFEGRIFGPEAEVRWVRDRGEWAIWRVGEAPDGVGCLSRSTPYYCWGEWHNGRFWEPRLRKEVEYPLPAACKPTDRQRARITVIEYFPAKPETWPDKPDAIAVLLNAPRMLASRFASLSVGTSEGR